MSIVSCVAILENCLQIFERMVLLQILPNILKTFADISDYILKNFDKFEELLKELFYHVYRATVEIELFRQFFNTFETTFHFFVILNQKYTSRPIKSRRNCFQYVKKIF